MATTRTRQRKLERDRYERKLVRRAQHQRRKRQVWAGIGAFLVLALVGTGVAWLAGVFEPDDETPPTADPGLCNWQERDPASYEERVDVGQPPDDPPATGQQLVTLELDGGEAGSGPVEILVDLSAEPCGAATVTHLAAQGFYDGTTCHELLDNALRCGDPSGTGLGGPSFAFFGHNYPLPSLEGEGAPLYPAGTVALGDVEGENGSHLLIFFEDFAPDTPIYPILGTVTGGLDLVTAIGAAGTAADDDSAPAEEVRLETLTVTEAGEAPSQ